MWSVSSRAAGAKDINLHHRRHNLRELNHTVVRGLSKLKQTALQLNKKVKRKIFYIMLRSQIIIQLQWQVLIHMQIWSSLRERVKGSAGSKIAQQDSCGFLTSRYCWRRRKKKVILK